MKIYILIISCILLTITCKKDSQEYIETKNKLIGEWIEISPCDSCNIITFDENNKINELKKNK